jgi:hypothetical protein
LVGATVPRAVGQVAIAEYAMVGHALFGEKDLEALDKAVKLTPAQQEAVESLMRGALARARSVQAKMNQRIREESEAMQTAAADDPANYGEVYKKYMSSYAKQALEANKEISQIEREAMGDIMAVLDRGQIEKGWSAFERHRRRIIVDQYGYGMGLGYSPRLLVRGLKFSATDVAAMEPILVHYEHELDPLLIERMKGLERVNKQFAETGEYDQAVWSRPELAGTRINRLNVQTCQAMEKALSEEGRRLFLRQRVGVETQGQFQPPSMDESVKQILRLASLTVEQKERGRELAAKADDAAFEVLLELMRQGDANAMRDGEPDPLMNPAEWSRKWALIQRKSTEVISSLRKSLRGVLTPAQQGELDGEMLGVSGDDPFKLDRTPPMESLWIAKPEPIPGGTKARP